MISVGVEVMALVLILSVFNGLEEFQKGLFNTFDPDLKIVQAKGDRFQLTATQVKSISQLSGVKFVNPILEDQGLIRFQQKQLVVRMKGVDPSYLSAGRLKNQVVEGDYFIESGEHPFALVGIGVFLAMGMSFDNVFEPIEAWYPNHSQLKRAALNENAIRRNFFFPSGVLEVEQNFDNQTVIVPLDWMEELVGVPGYRSAYEIMLAPNTDDQAIKNQIQTILGSTYRVQTRNEQHAILLKAIKIEKLFVFLIMAFVMGIASFTLFYALSLLVLEKRKDLYTLMAMGVSRQQVFRAFIWVGALISFSGAAIGMLLGFVLATIQQQFGVISLGIPNALIEAYPIQMDPWDFIWTALVVILITGLAALFPARKAVQMTFNSFK
ncbi:FtsX-like permease family protein [Aquirufa sp. OSTEICH-129V]|uniref:FtsX-like permease family protein n=1 Tax=Aquirufa avitistagni TaxID=3104728 RepID=A0ABW6DB94_9BACT